MKNIVPTVKKITSDRINIIIFLFSVCCLLSRVNSHLFFIDILGHLSFHILIGGILLFVILLALKKLWASIICMLISVLLAIDILSSCNQCNALIEDKSQNYNKIRLMTYNTGLSEDFENIRKLILFEKPDVILFQEVSSQMHDKIKSLKSFFPYNAGLYEPLEHFSSVILSKYPLKNNKMTKKHVVLTNLIFEETELTIIGIHLYAPLNAVLTKVIYEVFYKNLAKPPADPNQFNLAIKQMEHLKTLIGNTNQNLILMGDLNMTATSKRFINFLKETNLHTYISYKHPTSTWPTNLPSLLGLQIDHVLFSKNFKVIEKKTTNHFGSDHRPLIVDLVF